MKLLQLSDENLIICVNPCNPWWKQNKRIMKNQIFKSKEFGQIRTCMVGGETYFVGKDVASALGYKKPENAIAIHVDKDDTLKQGGVDRLGRKNHVVFINESGLYSLILSSKLESAKRFKRWVTSEVLPAIRKNGRYELEQKIVETEMQCCKLEATLISQKPLTDYARTILNSTQTVTVTQIAQDYGFGPVRFNQLLAHLHIQHKVGGQWILYAPFLHCGYVQSFSSYFVKPDGEVQVKLHTRWTQSGRLFLYEELKKAGILPLIEIN